MRIPAELDARLVAEAERLDRSVSWLIVRALDGSIGGASQKVATQRAKAAEEPQKWTDDSLAEVPYVPPVKPSKEQLAAEATIVPQTPRRAGSKVQLPKEVAERVKRGTDLMAERQRRLNEGKG